MDTVLEQFLKNLSNEDADRIWTYLDGTPLAIEEMVKVISDSHPSLK
jgi:hypothetical protein